MRPRNEEDERGQHLLSSSSPAQDICETSKIYKTKIQEESLEELSSYMKYVYVFLDYLGITSADQRIEKKIKDSDRSCMKQRVLLSQYERKIKQQEKLISEKEIELRECIVYFEKRKNEIEECFLSIESIEEERQEQQQLLRKNPADDAASGRIIHLDNELITLNQDARKYEREKNEFAAKIIENEAFVREAENVLASIQVYSATLHQNYLRSRIERMRLAPLVGFGKKPLETIDIIVEDQKIAEETARLADSMNLWASEITERISEIHVPSSERKGIDSRIRNRYRTTSNNIAETAEKIIKEKNSGRYL